MKSVLFFIGDLNYFITHRLHLALAAHEKGFKVHILVPFDKQQSLPYCNQFTYHQIPLHRSSFNIIKDIKTLKTILNVYKKVRPCVVHHVAMKPIIYGTLIARLLGKSLIINAFGGLGYVFTAMHLRAQMIKKMVQILLKIMVDQKGSTVIVQNRDDQEILQKIFKKSSIVTIAGAGVDTEHFFYTHDCRDQCSILCPSRMLISKGIVELVDAFIGLLKKYPNWPLRLLLAGDVDEQNPQSLSVEQLESWQKNSAIQWLGYQKDLRPLYRHASMVVLPSYREGMPKSLLEAGASGCAIITCDVAGCRDLVQDGVDGLLVPPYNVDALEKAMEKLILDRNFAQRLAQKMRKKIEHHYVNDMVQEKTLALYK